MLYWAVVFFVVALIAGRIWLWRNRCRRHGKSQKSCSSMFLVLFIVSLLFGGLRRGPMV